MILSKTAMTFGVLVMGLMLGCGGMSQPPVAVEGRGPNPKPNNSTQPIQQHELPGAKPPQDKVYRTGAELFADIPKAAYPKFGSAAGVERAATKEWANENVKGRVIEWSATITKASVDGDGPFRVNLYPTGVVRVDDGRSLLGGFAFGAEFVVGGEKCAAFVRHGALFPNDYIPYEQCTADEAKQLAALEGKKVTFRAPVRDVRVNGEEYAETLREPKAKWKHFRRVLFVADISQPSVDGILPEFMKPKENK